ncbi:hypothetical protein ACFLWO_02745 [Chloroflexota bacterium]
MYVKIPIPGFRVAPISEIGREEKVDRELKRQNNLCNTDKAPKHCWEALPDEMVDNTINAMLELFCFADVLLLFEGECDKHAIMQVIIKRVSH